MPVEVTQELSPELQKVADLRDHVRKMEGGVEHAKSELKLAKELLESAQSELNTAIDELIDHERQPTLFDRLGDELKDEPAEPRTVVATPAAGDGDSGLVLVGNAQPGETTLAALPAGAAWRSITVEDAELASELHPLVMDAIRKAGVTTCGELADRLVAGETFGMLAGDLYDLQHQVELLSADDEHPITFNRGDREEPATVPGPAGVPTRGQFPADRTGAWQFKAAAFEFAHAGEAELSLEDAHQRAEYERLLKQIDSYRIDQARNGGTLTPQWGYWSEFTTSVRNAAGVSVAVEVLYKPDLEGTKGRDHFEFWAPCLAAGGYWSCEERFPATKSGVVQRPAKESLEDKAAKLAQAQADRFVKEQKKAARKTTAKQGA